MNGTGNAIKMDCATCHDPHGSPNYRILKTIVNGNTVGEYASDAGVRGAATRIPNGFVSSVETGWPVNGFRLHTAYPAYKPNYTTAMYAKGYDMTAATLANGCRRPQHHQGHERLVRRLSQHLSRPGRDVHQDEPGSASSRRTPALRPRTTPVTVAGLRFATSTPSTSSWTATTVLTRRR